MKLPKIRLWGFAVSVAGLAVVAWLVILASYGSQPIRRIRAMMPELLNAEHVLKVDVVRMRYGLDSNYDILNQDIEAIQRNLAQLDELRVGPDLSAALSDYRKTVAKEADLVETFKYQNAVSRNSLHYFQSDAINLLEELPHAGGGQDLQHVLTRLENVVLLLILGADVSQQEQARNLIQEVRLSAFPLTPYQRKTLDRLLRHADLLVKDQPKLEATTRALIDSGSRQRLAEIDRLASAEELRRQQGMQVYQWLMILVSSLVFAAMLILVRRYFHNQRQIANQREFLQNLTDNAGVGVMVAGFDDRLEFVNPQAAELLGYRQDELLGMNVHDGIHVQADGRQVEMQECEADGRVAQGENFVGEMYYRSKDGSIVPILLHAAPIRYNLGGEQAGGHILVFQDMSEIHEARKKMERLAYYDFLTGLPNRLLLQDRLSQSLAQARRLDKNLAFCVLDLDNFKSVNDSLGHAAGDELLKQVATRIKLAVRESDTVARLGGDEFAILMPEVADADESARLANRLVEAFHVPYRLGGLDVVCGVSLGITLFPQDADNGEALFRNADTAMFRAKESGKNQFQYYTEDMGAGAMERLRLESLLRHALERGEFELHYQPQFRPDGSLVGAEALLRWHSPELGDVEPMLFIPVAERCGCIVEIGEWVLLEACRQCSRWRLRGHEHFRVSVNLSVVQFRHGGLVGNVRSILEQTGLGGEALELEITETMLMENLAHNQEVLSELKQLGCILAIDDFGTGYSSLAYLKRFQVDRLKIDKSFVDGLGRDANDTAVVRAIISLARSMELNIVAEGVETEGQLNELSRLDQGDIVIQGYYFGRPMTVEALDARMDKGRGVNSPAKPNGSVVSLSSIRHK